MIPPNSNVRIITGRDQISITVGEPRRMAGEDWYRVRFSDGRIRNVPGRNLEIYEGPQDVETLLRKGAFGNREPSHESSRSPNCSARCRARSKERQLEVGTTLLVPQERQARLTRARMTLR